MNYNINNVNQNAHMLNPLFLYHVFRYIARQIVRQNLSFPFWY